MEIKHVIRLLPIRSGDLRSKGNIFAVIQESRNWGGSVVLFDKTETKWVAEFLQTNHLNDESIEVIPVPYEEVLVETIANWGSTQSSNQQQWVQVLAEDDAFLGLDKTTVLSDPQISMLVCPILFLYSNRSDYQNPLVFNPGLAPNKVMSIFKNGQNIADLSWYGLIRMDAFIAYSRWVSALPVRLWHLSNQGIWSAMFFGNIGLLKSFVFLKDHEHWGSSEGEKRLLKSQYLRIFGKEELFIWDSKLYWLGCLANCFFLQANYTSEYQNGILMGILRNLVSRPRLGHFLFLTSPRSKIDYLLNWVVSKTILLKLQISLACRIRVDVRSNCHKIFKRETNPLPEDFQRLLSFYDAVLTQSPAIPKN